MLLIILFGITGAEIPVCSPNVCKDLHFGLQVMVRCIHDMTSMLQGTWGGLGEPEIIKNKVGDCFPADTVTRKSDANVSNSVS